MNKLIYFIMLGFLSACSVVGPGERGVRVSLGSVSSEPKDSGAYVWVPFLLGMKKINVQIQKSDVKASAASKDMQEIQTEVAVNWSIDPSKVVELYKNIGDEDDILRRIINPAVNETLKAATATRNAEEILTKRTEVKNDIDNALKKRLDSYGVKLTDVSIVNLSFSPEFTQAIERKQIEEQKAKQAEYITQQATAQAKAAIETAKGESEARVLNAKAEAESQKALRETVSEKTLQLKALEKWNGVLPQIMGSGTVPFININQKITEQGK